MTYRFVRWLISMPALVGLLSLVIFPFGSIRESLGDESVAAEEVPSSVLERFDPLSPAEALASFDVAPGYRVELVAAEPLVVDPIAFCFDPAGRMIVVEMIDYSERGSESLGRVRRLTDRDGDGQMDEVETLAEGISWPTAVESWPGGVIVGAPPYIFFYPIEDDAQGRAIVGEQQTWFSGFSRSNVQGMMNSFRWGPDLRLHGASSSNAGEITGDTLPSPLRLGRQDFSIDPRDRAFRAVPGGAQHGMDFDRWGHKYLTSNSDHLQQALMFDPVAGRANRYSAVPALRRSIAADGPAADVYRNSPTEPWRLLRTHLRVTGQVRGVVEGGGRAAGYFTGATGVHHYDGDQWPAGDHPIALVADVGGNLVHRKRMLDDGLWKRGERIDDQTEFLRSPDTWFRPAQLGGGPDGALYVADMYREVIEHPLSLPPVIKEQVDLNSGNDRGRIWRVVSVDKPVRRHVEPLDKMSVSKLVEMLSHPNHWQRRTAARLLASRQAVEAIDPLRLLVTRGEMPETRLESLAVLEMLPDGISGNDFPLSIFEDSHAAVRERGLELATRLGVPLPPALLERLADDDSIDVRFRLAYAAPVLIADPAVKVELLGRIAIRDAADPWVRWAVEGSLGGSAIELLTARDTEFAELPAAQRNAWFRAIGCQILSGDDSDAVVALVDYLDSAEATNQNGKWVLPAIIAELSGIRPGGVAKPLAQWADQRLAAEMFQKAESRDAALAAMGDRMRLVGWASPEKARELLAILLSPTQTSKVQQTALVALVGNDPAATAVVLDSLPAVTPATAEIALNTLVSRVEGQAAIAAALESGELTADSLPIDVKRALGESSVDQVKEAVAKYLSSTDSPPTGELYETYAQSLHQTADLQQGQMVFKRVCATCHDPEAGRDRVGPDLVTVSNQPKEQILLSVLDPNREVNPKYARVQVVTVSGQVYSGIITDESESTIKLVDSQGKSTDIARSDIDDLQTSTKSLMPEELNKEITPAQMRDLIAFLVTRRAPDPTAAAATE